MTAGARRKVGAAAWLVGFFLLLGHADAAVYWANDSGVSRANGDGSAHQREFIPQAPGPSASDSSAGCAGIAVTGSKIYWAIPAGNSIGEANLDGTQPNYGFITGLENPCGVAVDSTALYWTEFKGQTIGRANLAGGEVDRSFITGLKEPCGVAVTGEYIYWTANTAESPESHLTRRPLGGGLAEDLYGTSSANLCGVAVDSQHVYWGGFGESIGRAGLDGSNLEPSFVTGIERPCGVAVDGSSIYWGRNGWTTRSIQAAALEGAHTARTVVEVELGNPCGVAVDGVVAQLPPPPPPPPAPISHAVIFGHQRHSKRPPATYVSVQFPLAGTFAIGGSRAVRMQVVSDKSAPYALAGPEERVVKVSPASGGRPARFLRKQLAVAGKAWAAITVRFSAVDGTTSTKRKMVSLVAPRRRPKRKTKATSRRRGGASSASASVWASASPARR